MELHISDHRLARLPVFPLPDVHLFPGTLLPLHVFEPRYVAMLDHCLNRADRAIAVACLAGGDHGEIPAIRPIMGAGVIMAAKETEEGTWNIVVRGLDRVMLQFEHPPEHVFREVAVQRLATRAAEADDSHYGRLRLLVARVAEQSADARRALDLVLDQAETPDELVYLLMAHVVSDARIRRSVMEAEWGATRLSIACDAIATLLLHVATSEGEYSTLH